MRSSRRHLAVSIRIGIAPLLFDKLFGSIRDFSLCHEFENDVCLVGVEAVRRGLGARSRGMMKTLGISTCAQSNYPKR
jgi:hypothetical protein